MPDKILCVSHMNNQLFIAVISSSLLSAVLGALIAGAYALKNRQNEYVNEYYKTVIQRRITAYEQLENLIVSIKTCVLDKDNKPYHLLFSKADDWDNLYILIYKVISQSLWLSEDAFMISRDLNYLVFLKTPDETDMIEFGKQNYEKIASIRAELEKILAIDMLDLHNVKKFLKNKMKVKHDFHNVNLNA